MSPLARTPRRQFLQSSAAALLPALQLRDAPGQSLAKRLADLYTQPGAPGERWGRRRTIEIAGTQVPREKAYRDERDFAKACAVLLESGTIDDTRLGAWLLGGASAPGRKEAALVAQAHAQHTDPVTRFYVQRSLLELGESEAVRRMCSRAREPHLRGLGAITSGTPAPAGAFERGACFWFEGQDDFGAAQFRKLKKHGVTHVSIHTWDPLQDGRHNPVLLSREARRSFGLGDLRPWVESAHKEGLRVTFKPHLEMGFKPPSAEDRRAFERGNEAERRAARARLEKARADQGWHGEIEMLSERDWKTWFAGYSTYTLEHASHAARAGADAFCVGREIDRTALKREGDWRELIRRVRLVFKGSVTYSAHHDTFGQIPFWDALDHVGVAAYVPLSSDETPSPGSIGRAWRFFIARCERLSTATKKRVVFSEVGYPALATAAREPWRENTGAAEPIIQSDLLAAALAAARSSGSPAVGTGIGGTYVWLWEGVSAPPFRDRSFTIQDKPASAAMAGAYLQQVEPPRRP